MTAGSALAGHLAARTLRRAGVPWVTGVSGESFLPLLDGLRREGVPFHALLQEGSAAFMAGAFARASGRPAVLAVTRGPGLSNALIGLHEAMQGGVPLVAIVGQVESRMRGRGALQEMDYTELLRSAVKDVHEVTRADRIAPAVAGALRKSMLGRPGPVVVSVPADLFYEEVGADDPAVPDAPAAGVLGERVVAEIADRLARSERALVVVGTRFANGRSADTLAALAERTGSGIVGGHVVLDALPSDHPQWLGGSTIRSAAPLRDALVSADLVVFLDHWPGDRVTHGYQPLGGHAVSIAADHSRAWDEYPAIRTVDADPVAALDQLVAAARPAGRERRAAWVAGVRSDLERSRASLFAQARGRGEGIVPMPDVLDALDEAMPSGSTLVSDTGSYNDWVTRYLRFPVGRRYLGTLSGSMGFGVPASIAAQLAFPDGRTVALAGDGAFLMNGLELATIARMRLPITVIVLRNGVWGSIAMHQDRAFPGQRFAIDLPAVSFAKVAEACGVPAAAASSAEALRSALTAALASDGPSLIEVAIDGVNVSPASFEDGAVDV